MRGFRESVFSRGLSGLLALVVSGVFALAVPVAAVGAEPPVIVTGTVTDGDTGDPIVGLTVAVWWIPPADQPAGAIPPCTAITNAAGAFTVRDTEGYGAGNFGLELEVGPRDRYTPYPVPISWNGSTAVTQDLKVWKPRTFARGTVVDALSAEPIEDVRVRAYEDGCVSYVAEDVTASDGSYTLINSGWYPAGQYVFAASATGYLPSRKPETYWNGADALPVDFALHPMRAIAGTDRFGTAILASQSAYPTVLDPDGARTVLIATAHNWPDALGGTSLAGALDGPILLAHADNVPEIVLQEIERLDPAKAIVLGGEQALDSAVVTALESLLGEDAVERIGGEDRYETAELIAARTRATLDVAYDGTALIATGGDFPDALSGAPLAAAQGWPIYLADPTVGLRDTTRSAMSGVTDVVILGGEAAVSEGVEEYVVEQLGDEHVTRLTGGNRYETAVAAASYAVTEAGHGWNGVGITTGEDFPDALVGGVVQGKAGSVILLTLPSSLYPGVAAKISANKADITSVTVFGGLKAVTEEARFGLSAALE